MLSEDLANSNLTLFSLTRHSGDQGWTNIEEFSSIFSNTLNYWLLAKCIPYQMHNVNGVVTMRMPCVDSVRVHNTDRTVKNDKS